MREVVQSLARGDVFHRVLRTIVVPSPLAGADWSFTVPGGSVWEPVAVRALFTTAVAVANRIATLVITDGSATLMTLPNVEPQAASQVNSYTWAAGASPTAGAIGAVGAVCAGMPDLALPAGFTIAASTFAIQAADQWSAVTLFVVETLSQPAGTHANQDAARSAFLLDTQLASEGS